MESHLIGSYEHLVLSNECISAVRRFMKGAPVNAHTLALDVIQEVGDGLPNKIFVDRDHTTECYLEEQWAPDIFNRNNFDSWTKKGSKSTHDWCNDKVRWILENHQPEQLSDDVLKQLEEIARDATDPETLAVSKTKKAKRRRKFRAV